MQPYYVRITMNIYIVGVQLETKDQCFEFTLGCRHDNILKANSTALYAIACRKALWQVSLNIINAMYLYCSV